MRLGGEGCLFGGVRGADEDRGWGTSVWRCEGCSFYWLHALCDDLGVAACQVVGTVHELLGNN